MTNGRTACVGRVWSWSSLVGSTDGGKQWDLTHSQTACINSLKHSVYENPYIASFLLPFIRPSSQFATLWRGWFLSQLSNFHATFSSNLIRPHTYTLVKPIGLITAVGMCTWQVSRKFALCVGDVLHMFAFNTRLDGNAETHLPHIYDRKQNFTTSQEEFANVPVLWGFVAKLLPKKQLITLCFQNSSVRNADCEWC